MAARARGGGRGRAFLAFFVVLLVGTLVGSALSQWGAPAIVPVPETARVRAAGRVRVEVLNGGGYAGAAREATEALRESGFDVVYFGNAGADRDSSVVLDRMGELDPARTVADALSIRNVRSEPDSNLYLDVSVVLGRDWQPLRPPEPEASEAEKRPWWDPRGWVERWRATRGEPRTTSP